MTIQCLFRLGPRNKILGNSGAFLWGGCPSCYVL